MIQWEKKYILLFLVLALSACGRNESETDTSLEELITTNNLTGNALKGRSIPDIESPKAQLGMHLFFSKSLSGDSDSACVTCHHPVLGGGDDLSFSIGVGAKNPDLLGVGRLHDINAANYTGAPPVPRNTPTTFNIAAWDKVLFHDGRIESLGKTVGANGNDNQGIRTPDTAFGVSDAKSGNNLVAAQSRFPLTSHEEMMGFNSVKNNQQIRDYLASRLGGYGEGAGELSNRDYWLFKFRDAFENVSATAEELITEQNIADAIGEYERSQAFSDTPWRRYIEGNHEAMKQSAKDGAMLFFTPISQGGAQCADCHSGDLFSDEKFHNIAMPQIGNGKGDGADGTADFGRFRESNIEADKYAFRTPSLLNIEVTKPYSHTGAYASLKSVIIHHLNPALAITNYDSSKLTQTNISNLDKMKTNTQPALDKLQTDQMAGISILQNIELSDKQIDQLVDFLKALTDPCVKSRECLSKWIPNPGEDPNKEQLDAVDANGVKL